MINKNVNHKVCSMTGCAVVPAVLLKCGAWRVYRLPYIHGLILNWQKLREIKRICKLVREMYHKLSKSMMKVDSQKMNDQ